MKILKYVGIAVIGLVLLVLVAGLLVPAENHVERSVVIDASAEDVQSHIMSFEGMLAWSPWADRDPNQTVTIENDGQVGALYTWSGEDSLVGSGSQTILSMSDNEVVTELHFTSPYEGKAKATTMVEESEEGVKVTWMYDDKMPYPMNAMNLFMDMDEMLGPDFELGMARLKDLVESSKGNSEASAISIQTVEMPERTYLGWKDSISWTEMKDYFENTFGKSYGMVSEAGIEMAGMPSALYFEWNEDKQSTVLMAGMPVASGSEVEGMEAYTVGGNALMVEYYGAYEGIGDAHMALDEYIKENGLTMGEVAIEEYVTDPQTEPDTLKWLTKVYYPLVN